MPGDGKSAARAVAVAVSVLLAIIALRGYLPGAEPAEREPATEGPGSLVAVVAMLAVSITVIAISIVAQARRRTPAPGTGEPPRQYRGERTAVPWRLLLIAAAGLLAWLLVVALLMQWASVLAVDDVPVADPEPGATRETGGAPPPPPETPSGGSDAFGLLAAATMAMVVLAAVAAMIGRRRVGIAAAAPVDGDHTPTPLRSAGPDLARAAELGLAEIGDRSRDPREAIIACYAAMERELEKSPGTTPQDSDTPAEVLARAVERHALRPDSATELVDLFEEARFSPHVMNEGHRADAVRALRLVQRELQGAS